jgi:hypothetical protein
MVATRSCHDKYSIPVSISSMKALRTAAEDCDPRHVSGFRRQNDQAFHDIAAVAIKFVPKLKNDATVDKMSARSNGPFAGSPILLNIASALNENRRKKIPVRTTLFGYKTDILHTTIASAAIRFIFRGHMSRRARAPLLK